MKRIISNLNEKNKQYIELEKITSGMLYDLQENDNFEILLEMRDKTVNLIDKLDDERKQLLAAYGNSDKEHLKQLMQCNCEPISHDEKRIYNIVGENRKLVRRIMTLTKNIDFNIKKILLKG